MVATVFWQTTFSLHTYHEKRKDFDMSKMIFVCPPASDDQKLSEAKLMCFFIAKRGHVPVSPDLYFPLFITEHDNDLVEAMMSYCDELWTIGKEQTAGNNENIALADKLLIPVRRFESLRHMADLLDRAKAPEPEKKDLLDAPEDVVRKATEYAIHRAFMLEDRLTIDRSDIEMVIALSVILRSQLRKEDLPEGDALADLMKEHMRQIADYLHLDVELVWHIIRTELEDRANENRKD